MQGMNMGTMAPPPSPSPMNITMPRKKMMMHMSFYWGDDAIVLFRGWPGSNTGMYVLSLVFVFVLVITVEWITHSRVIGRFVSGKYSKGALLTVMHALRVGLAYMLMLAVMSFNGGVFIVAVVGHALGFLLFGSRVFGSGYGDDRESDLPPMRC